ncbi:hypothetical protein [Cesiribacter andamanensis]|uniref:Transposase n=1 Tax=Cesiribacter andamanensis AMV16 TaxID=1279009 RepID=M7N5Z1_9BACT|nr:hypothetical protein [Cesiribacter andamanensis]EMR02656.1 hypothetical protein ADICEAN_02195 [Cesiribacter andamanensis AMV16]
MLEYFKTILSKVSFSRELFERELRKAIASLVPKEVEQLRDWCYTKYRDLYGEVLNRCFVGFAA